MPYKASLLMVGVLGVPASAEAAEVSGSTQPTLELSGKKQPGLVIASTLELKVVKGG